MRNAVFREHGKAKAVYQLGNCVVDLRIVVIRASGNNDSVRVVLLHPCQSLVAKTVHGVLELEVRLPGNLNCVVYLLASNVGAHKATLALRRILLALHGNKFVQATLEFALVVVGQERGKILDLRVRELVHV